MSYGVIRSNSQGGIRDWWQRALGKLLGMATAVQLSGLHAAQSCMVAAQNIFATEKTQGRLSKAPCSLSSCSSVSRGAWLCTINAVKVESSKRLCSSVAAASAASAASFDDAEDVEASSMEWLSPISGNPMEEWLLRRSLDEREGDSWREGCGVVAIFGDPEASRLCYLSLHALQHGAGGCWNRDG